jgi:outer membrane biosynthesis protein TonB
MSRDDRDGFLVSVTAHVVVLLVLALLAATPSRTLDPDYPPQLVEVEFGPAPVPPVVTGPPESAAAGAPSDARRQPEPERPTPPAPTRARVPERTVEPPPRDNPVPRPARQDDARPDRPNPPSRATAREPRPTPPTQTRDTEGRGTSEGAGSTSGASDGPGQGSGGDAPVEVGFQFGNRSFDCPVPPFGGVEGAIVYRVTFAPSGRYVASSPVSRSADFERAVRGVISRCRAEPLPPNARQVNQTTRATFAFRAN